MKRNLPEEYKWIQPGVPAEYSPRGMPPQGPWYPCVVDEKPRVVAGDVWAVRLRCLPIEFCNESKRYRDMVPSASCFRLRPSSTQEEGGQQEQPPVE